MFAWSWKTAGAVYAIVAVISVLMHQPEPATERVTEIDVQQRFAGLSM